MLRNLELVVFDLRWGGFDENDVRTLMTTGPSEIPRKVEVQYHPTVEGPDSYRILVQVAQGAAAMIASGSA